MGKLTVKHMEPPQDGEEKERKDSRALTVGEIQRWRSRALLILSTRAGMLMGLNSL